MFELPLPLAFRTVHNTGALRLCGVRVFFSRLALSKKGGGNGGHSYVGAGQRQREGGMDRRQAKKRVSTL